VAGCKFSTEDPQILGAAIKKSVVYMTWCPGFVHPWLYVPVRRKLWQL